MFLHAVSDRVERALTPLDRLRAALYRWAAPVAAPLYADRPRRVRWLGAILVMLGWLLAATLPLWMLALAPVVLGVPHLLADLRYLVVRPGRHHQPWFWLSLPAWIGTSVGGGPVLGLAGLVPAVLAARGSLGRKLALLGGWALLSALAWREDFLFQLLFLHLHNLVAIAWWWVWRPRGIRDWILPLLIVGGALALLCGAAEPLLDLTQGWTAFWTGTDFGDQVTQLAPGVDPALAWRLVLVFGFLQSVHYGVWLRLIPEDDRPRPAPRPFRASWQALLADFGPGPLLAVAGLAGFILAWAVIDLPGARLGYLWLAAGHGYLELAVAAHLLADEPRPLAVRDRPAPAEPATGA